MEGLQPIERMEPKGAPLPGDAVDADAYVAVSPKGKQRRSSPSFPCGLKQRELLGGDGDGPTFRQGDVIGIIPRGRQQDQILSLGHGRLKNQLQRSVAADAGDVDREGHLWDTCPCLPNFFPHSPFRQGVERSVHPGVVGVEVHPLHLVRGLPLGEPIILSLSACHKKSLLS